jgi:uncharacterized protein
MTNASELIAINDQLMRANGQNVPSPCISVCQMDAAGAFCLGCLRTLPEISAWAQLDDAGRRSVWQRIADRAERLMMHRPLP